MIAISRRFRGCLRAVADPFGYSIGGLHDGSAGTDERVSILSLIQVFL
jgi:hypothetical protein